MSANLDLARRWLAAVEAGADATAFLAADAVQEEMPNRLFPAGRTNDLAAMRANAAKGKDVIATQRYEILSATCEGDRVALELHWTGTLKVGFGAIAAGASLEARVAMFLTFRDGQIVHLRNYDCYAPF
jgi:ketosteroid isomerase-like protein